MIILLKLDKQFSIDQFEPTVSQSTVSSPPSGEAAWSIRGSASDDGRTSSTRFDCHSVMYRVLWSSLYLYIDISVATVGSAVGLAIVIE